MLRKTDERNGKMTDKTRHVSYGFLRSIKFFLRLTSTHRRPQRHVSAQQLQTSLTAKDTQLKTLKAKKTSTHNKLIFKHLMEDTKTELQN